ncbi:hypothetical protein N7478_004239 [Penicillium angulare]|uniref:uncharacterized protein n=1 Tax=Penicillium angulare TaxID=116970 RepID=UPI002540FE71|nr:uncharacterized protein N7478_004239 [Penicillium angulare]KAJ5278867.1 hypothetical protein N7478_004239 [Penicillium angulare]
MPSFIVKCHEGVSDDQIQTLKKQIEEQGGNITQDFSIIKGFGVEFPEDRVSMFANHEHIEFIEADGEVTTQ